MSGKKGIETLLTQAGCAPDSYHGIINIPTHRASTVLFDSLEDMKDRDSNPFDSIKYGRFGTPTSQAFESAMAELEGGYRSVTMSSGLAALTTTFLAYARAGSHFLVSADSYEPLQRFCLGFLKKLGVETEFYDPCLGADIGALVRPNTALVHMESPGSSSFKIQDVPAIVKAVRGRNPDSILSIDNTWATPLFFNPLAHGVDVVIHSAAKYISGHSDLMLGVCVCQKSCFETIKKTAIHLGQCAGPDDLTLALRGLKTLSARLKVHHDSALTLIKWLKTRPEVGRVLYPALPEDESHALWKRDFTGAGGVFAMEVKTVSKKALSAMIDSLELFGIGYSWGGFRSLILPVRHLQDTTLLRLYVGLEGVDDLRADLEAGLKRLRTI